MEEIVKRLIARDEPRTEAMIQSDVRQFILLDPFELNAGEVDNVVLESPLGDRRRIDVEVGSTVLEVKKDLRNPSVLKDAIAQLAGYVETRQSQTGRRYLGVITDGAEWHCYHLVGTSLEEASSLQLSAPQTASGQLIVWLEGVLATARGITPNAAEIDSRLGAGSSAYALDKASLKALYEKYADLPTVKLKRALWSRLLTSALGTQFDDQDDLFIEHTLLVNSAEIIAHALLGLDISTLAPTALLLGTKFDESAIYGVVEQNFFDWPIEVPPGAVFVRSLAKRLARFDWASVDQDVLKVLYESIIGRETRKRLGEYYTPDWLAHRMVETTIEDPLTQTVLDPACGSGTFLFHAAKRFLDAAEIADLSTKVALERLTSTVFGMDLHPVAVTFARVTYLLAIGRKRLLDPNRGAIQIPVYLGDSMQWQQQEASLFAHGQLVVHADHDGQLFGNDLVFPDSLLQNVSMFDQLVSELASRASHRNPNDAVPNLSAVYQRFGILEVDRSTIAQTFKTMCSLHDQGRDHIWGYYIRNLVRPVWLSKLTQRVDVLIGNPPWLAYRHMTREMQAAYRAMCESRGIWHGAELATHQDLSALFVCRSIQLYLKEGGQFAMVMPNAVIDREQYGGFRSGNFPDPKERVRVAFDRAWDLRRIRPHFFPRGAGVVFGKRAEHPSAMSRSILIWSGKTNHARSPWHAVADALTVEDGTAAFGSGASSPYRTRFTNGATFIPYKLLFVDQMKDGPLGLAAGKMRVRSAISAYEKKPWKNLDRYEGVVESEFVRAVLSGEHLLPYRTTAPLRAVVPLLKGDLLAPGDGKIDMYPGLADWWTRASSTWTEHRSSDRMTLTDRLNYQNGLTKQVPIASRRVIYNASGMHVYAAKLSTRDTFISNALYWAVASSDDEADYLCAILNSPVITELVRPLMPYGKDERHIHKHVWKLPIPEYDASNDIHRRLSKMAREAEALMLGTDVEGRSFVTARQVLRRELEASDVGREISELVYELTS